MPKINRVIAKIIRLTVLIRWLLETVWNPFH